MANILTDLLATRDMTPILAIEKNKLSSLQGESSKSVEKIVIRTEHILRKEGSKFYIDKEEINLEQLNVLDVLILLKKKGMKVAFINNTDYWYYPALCILDFNSVEYYEEVLDSSPKYLSEYKYFKNLSINPLDDVELTIRRIFNPMSTDVLPYRVVENILLVERGISFFVSGLWSKYNLE